MYGHNDSYRLDLKRRRLHRTDRVQLSDP